MVAGKPCSDAHERVWRQVVLHAAHVQGARRQLSAGRVDGGHLRVETHVHWCRAAAGGAQAGVCRMQQLVVLCTA